MRAMEELAASAGVSIAEAVRVSVSRGEMRVQGCDENEDGPGASGDVGGFICGLRRCHDGMDDMNTFFCFIGVRAENSKCRETFFLVETAVGYVRSDGHLHGM